MSGSTQHVAIISGGAGDIGRAIALELARQGADIALGDIVDCDERVTSLMAAVESLGRRIRFDFVNVVDPQSVGDWFQAVEESFGVPDLIIPNAAVVTRGTLGELTPEAWKTCCDVTLHGAFHVAINGAKRLVCHRRAGRIVFIGSWAAHAPHANVPAYSVAKAGVRMLMQLTALEYAQHRILVNEVAPGYVDAGLSKAGFDKDPEKRRQCEKQVPVGELMHPDDVAIHVAYLCDERNCFMTGSTLLVDGGLSLLTRLNAERDGHR